MTATDNGKKFRVIFSFVEAGYGHVAPMMAMADAFEKKYGDCCEIVRWYIFRDSKHPVVRKYGKGLANDTRRLHKSWTYSLLEHTGSVLMGRRGSLAMTDFLSASARKKAMQDIAEMNPDMFVSSYYSPAHFAMQARRKYNLNYPVVSYSPDPFIYNVWDRKLDDIDLFVVNNDRAYSQGLKTGLPMQNMRKVPFVARNKPSGLSKRELREKLNLPVDKFTAVLTDGGYALGKMERTARELVKADVPLTVVAVCGENSELRRKIASWQVNENVTLVSLGFVNNLQEYISASDLVIGKGGSNTICECMISSTPMVVNHFGGMLEKITAKYYMEECGQGVIITDKKKLCEFVNRCAKDPSVLKQYADNTVNQRTDGAEVMADLLYSHLLNCNN